MIGKLRGVIDIIEKEFLILDVQGVGYLVFCSTRTLQSLASNREPVNLWIETHVREDHIHLYGFLHHSEQECFRALTTVQGVGAKVALAILGTWNPAQISQALTLQDKAVFTKVSGIGPKLATRIITELKSHQFAAGDIGLPSHEKMSETSSSSSETFQDTLSALINLGYQRQESYRVVSRILNDQPDLTVSQAIRNALKELAK